MRRSVRFHPLATAEVVEAQLWYEHRVEGLGGRFLHAVRTTTSRAAQWPNAGTPTRHDDSGVVLERKVVVAGFPYLVVYRDAGDLEILAVHHERRRPDYWADRTE